MSDCILDPESRNLVVQSICHAAEMSHRDIREAASRYERPSAIFRPALSIDGNMWCALYGANLQDGVAGFGKSPADAMWDFDRNWHATLTETTT